jgi:arylsulfatase A-like enzyme
VGSGQAVQNQSTQNESTQNESTQNLSTENLLPDHLVLVSIDGLRPEFYQDVSWPAPTLQQMAREGVHAERQRGVFPSVTYPSHTTLVTGALPARHGIMNNRPFEPAGQTGRWYWEASAIQVPALWDVLHAAGRTSAAVSWPVTVGATIDWVVPEVWALEGDDRLAPMRATTRPEGLWQELEREATGRISPRNYSADFMSRDDTTAAIASYLFETKRPTLLLVHLLAADHFQHEAGREAPVTRRSVAAVDRALSRLRETVERTGLRERTAFIVTGDHGFVDVHTEVAPNVWLAQAGIQGTAPDRGRWRATFHTTSGSAFLHLAEGEGEEVTAQVRRLLEALPQNQRRLFRIVERDELDAIGADPRAPFALAAPLGIAFTDRAAGPDLASASGAQHGYFPSDFSEIYTGFVGWGAGFARGMTVHEIRQEDVAPIVARLLGLDFEAPDGQAPLGVLAQP